MVNDPLFNITSLNLLASRAIPDEMLASKKIALYDRLQHELTNHDDAGDLKNNK